MVNSIPIQRLTIHGRKSPKSFEREEQSLSLGFKKRNCIHNKYCLVGVGHLEGDATTSTELPEAERSERCILASSFILSLIFL